MKFLIEQSISNLLVQAILKRLGGLPPNVKPEMTVAIELVFVEELISRALVRKLLVAAGVLADVNRFCSIEGRLEVDYYPFFLRIRIFNSALRVAGRAEAAPPFFPESRDILVLEMDLHAKVCPTLADGVGQISEGVFRVAASITGNDEATTPANELVNSYIVEVPSVGQINPPGPGGCRPA